MLRGLIMLIRDLLNLVDYPDDVRIEIYSYAIYDTVFCGSIEELELRNPEFLNSKISGLEFPKTNCVIINI